MNDAGAAARQAPLWIMVDIETSGPVIGKHDMTELGAVVGSAGRGVIDRFEALIRPGGADEDVTASRASHAKAKAAGIPPREAMERFEAWARPYLEQDARFVARPAAFDWPWIVYYAWKHLGRNPFGFKALCASSWFEARGKRFEAELPHVAVRDAEIQLEKFLEECAPKPKPGGPRPEGGASPGAAPAARPARRPGLRDLVKSAKDPDEERAVSAVKSLGKVGPRFAEGVIPALLEALADKRRQVRLHAAESLGRISAQGSVGSRSVPAVVPALLRAAADDDAFVREFVREALSAFVPPCSARAVPIMLDALERPGHPGTRMAAALTLALAGAAQASRTIPALIEALSEGSELERSAAALCLASLGPRDHRVASALFDNLGRDAGSYSIPDALITLLKADPAAILGRVIEKLDRGGEAEAAAAAHILRYSDADARTAEAFVPHLVNALGSPSPRVRAAACEALSRQGLAATPAVPAIAERLRDEVPGVRIKAVLALQDLAAREALGELKALLSGGTGRERRAAASAIKSIAPELAAEIDAGWTREVLALSFLSLLPLEEMKERLNSRGPWEWLTGDSAWWGDYLGSAPDGPDCVKARIYEAGEFRLELRFESNRPAAQAKAAWKALEALVRDRLLPLLDARDVRPCDTLD